VDAAGNVKIILRNLISHPFLSLIACFRILLEGPEALQEDSERFEDEAPVKTLRILLCKVNGRSPRSHFARPLNSSPRPLAICINRACIESIIHVGVGASAFERKLWKFPKRQSRNSNWSVAIRSLSIDAARHITQ
jgi:hypothetical protein